MNLAITLCILALAFTGRQTESRAYTGRSTASQVNTQQQPESLHGFDVVSVRPDRAAKGLSVRITSDTFEATGVTVVDLISNAYGLRSQLITGVPNWARNLRFDVTAKIVDSQILLSNASVDQRRLLLQKLLRDRFRLNAHLETKVLPVYDLTTIDNGRKLRDSARSSSSSLAVGSMSVSHNHLVGTQIPLTSLIAQLESQLERTVVDKTGFSGIFSVDLSWETPSGEGDNFDSTSAMVRSLRDELGLRLEPSKGAVAILVVNSISEPSEN